MDSLLRDGACQESCAPEPHSYHAKFPLQCGPDFNAKWAAPVALAMMLEGVSVFPIWGMRKGKFGLGLVCQCGGGPTCKPGKHPAVPYTRRSADDLDTFYGHHQRFPRANWGARTGQGIWVLDIDSERGADSKVALERELGELPLDTWRAKSGRKGYSEHIWFRTPLDANLSNSAKTLGPDLDARGTGGVIVLPGSLHASGQRYTWTRSPTEAELADLPPGWLTALSAPERLQGARTSRPARSTGTLRPAAVQAVGEARYRFGDGDGYGGFNGPIYQNALRYFARFGVTADAQRLAGAMRGAIAKAPKAEGRCVERYLSEYMEEQIERARAFIAEAA